MSWSLNASGHIPAADAAGAPQDALALETDLYERLREILADPKYGASGSSFGGSHVSGALHELDAPGI